MFFWFFWRRSLQWLWETKLQSFQRHGPQTHEATIHLLQNYQYTPVSKTTQFEATGSLLLCVSVCLSQQIWTLHGVSREYLTIATHYLFMLIIWPTLFTTCCVPRTSFLAGKYAEKLRANQPELEIDDKDILCLYIAALCHDLGHGPFSHTWEHFMKRHCKDYSVR